MTEEAAERGMRELEWLLRVARPVYRVASVLLGVLAVADAALGVLVWSLRDSGSAAVGAVLLAVALMPALAALWLRGRVRRGRHVQAGDLRADLRAVRGIPRARLAGLSRAGTRRPRERSWRRFARLAWRARSLADDVLETEAPALRSVLAPFAPGTIALGWLAAVGLPVLAILAIALALGA